MVKRLKCGISHTGCEPRIESEFLKDLGLEAAGQSSWSLLHAGVCVCVCVSVSLSLPSLEIFPAYFQTGHSFRKFIAPLKERLLVTDLQSYFVEAGVAKDLCDRQTKLMLEAKQPI